ncbi:hypothetical protein [Marisediminicola sp. LYQ85]|uniref:hypothetical protein n=1 Tax=Marisediminicola sp. LYQ85 TaxID=3391062 RepID=UPI0039835D80
MTSRLQMRLILIFGVILTVAGLALLVVTLSQPVIFGWFGSAPLSPNVFAPGLNVYSTPQVMSAGVLIVGLLVLTFWAGFRVGSHRRVATRPRPPID